MSNFNLYFTLGREHIANITALDHILFIAALCTRYQLADWKKILVLVTAFTIGHSVTLALSVLNVVHFSTSWIEFLIPVTILITAISNLLTGTENISYYNNSPDVLTYLWIQLDENEHNNLHNANYQDASLLNNRMTNAMINRLETSKEDNGYGDKIHAVINLATGRALPYTINKTMMRVDLPQPLKPGQQFNFKINWSYKISDRMQNGWPWWL